MALTQVSSDGIKNLNVKTADLENSGVTAGTYGSASLIPALVIDAKGRVTSASTNAISTDLVNDTSPQLGGDLDTNSFEILLDDLHAVKFGDSADLSIFHQSGFNQIQSNNTSPIQLRDSSNVMLRANPSGSVDLRHNGSAKFETTSSGVEVFGELQMDDANSHIKIPDNARLDIGNSNDLQIYHNPSANTNEFTSSLSTNFRGKNLYFYVGANVSSEQAIMAYANQGVELYYNNSKTAWTTGTGFNIKGGNTAAQTELQIYGNEGRDAEILLGADDGDDNADYWKIISSADNSFYLQNYTAGSYETNIKATGNSSVELYFDNSKKLNTYGSGIQVSGGIALSASSGSDPVINNADGASGRFMCFFTGGSMRMVIEEGGNVRPASNNTYDLGTSSDRWRNVYTNDLNLSNEGGVNDVDGTWGSFTIQEGESDLFLKNNRSGKKYKFNLTEVS